MKAFMRERYGSPEVLEKREIARPTPREGEVLIKLRSVSLNASDWECLVGQPLYARLFGVIRPRVKILGSDIAGELVARGGNANRFRIGDAVYGDVLGTFGGLAGYVCAPESKLSLKPAKFSFQEAASLPQAGCIALQGIFDQEEVKPGASVLINGAGGGSGAFAIQIAKYRGAFVTGVDTAEKQESMKAMGTDQVLDYKWEDFTRSGEQYDLILDLAAHKSIFDYVRALKKGGRYMMVGGSMFLMLQLLLLGPLVKAITGKRVGILAVKPNQGLDVIVKLIEYGRISFPIDRVFSFDDAPAALSYLGNGETLGKVIIDHGAEG